MKYQAGILFFMSFFIYSTALFADSDIVIKKDIIKGNSELPKIMYIIPWQTTLTETKFKGVQLENYLDSLIKPFHPHRVHIE